MRFLADESCDDLVARSLSDAGYDVASVRNLLPGSTDEEVIAVARREGRVLLTEDTDFGRLFFASSVPESGVILIRYPTSARSTLGAAVHTLVDQMGERISGAFVVLKPGRVRIVARNG